MVDQPYQFDFYDGGGLDLAFLSFAEVDERCNVNVSRFGGRIVGPAASSTSARTRRPLMFSGTFTQAASTSAGPTAGPRSNAKAPRRNSCAQSSRSPIRGRLRRAERPARALRHRARRVPPQRAGAARADRDRARDRRAARRASRRWSSSRMSLPARKRWTRVFSARTDRACRYNRRESEASSIRAAHRTRQKGASAHDLGRDRKVQTDGQG